MPIALPEVTGLKFLAALRDTADTLRAIRDQTGDLPFATINNAQNSIARLRLAYVEFSEDATLQPVTARDYVAARGGPTTLAEIQSRVQTAAGALGGWHTALQTVLGSLTSEELIQLVNRTTGSVTTRHVESVSFIPAAKADPLRQSTQLANLIAALEALGG